MLFDIATADHAVGDDLILKPVRSRWGVDSDHGRLLDVMASPPGSGVTADSVKAERQHRALIGALEAEGVRCHAVPPSDAGPGLAIRDCALMTPWGLLTRNAAVGQAARALGLPLLGAIDIMVAGGNVAILRPGLVAIGWSGADEAGARALARLFRARGWTALVTRVDPYFRRLGALFAVVDGHRALACLEALEPGFVNRLWMLGLELMPVTIGEAQRMGASLLSLGGDCILSSADNGRINIELARRGYRVVAVEIDAFLGRDAGIRCLTLPLARLPG